MEDKNVLSGYIEKNKIGSEINEPCGSYIDFDCGTDTESFGDEDFNENEIEWIVDDSPPGATNGTLIELTVEPFISDDESGTDLVAQDSPCDDIEEETFESGMDLVAQDSPRDDIEEEIAGACEVRQGRPKRGRKRKVHDQTRADRKKLLNTNKTHINTKGNVYQEKVFDTSFVCTCPKKCTDIVSSKRRKRLFMQFQSMGTFEGRCAFLTNCVSEKPKNRTYSKNPTRNRSITRNYNIFGTEVCQRALLRTLQINKCRFEVAIRKQKNCDSFEDGRGKASGGKNALPPWKLKEVRDHIESFPKYVSHYTRNQTESKFLNSNLNLSKMYRLYKAKTTTNPVSKSFYKKVFYRDYNLRFKIPKKDTCLKCDIYKNKIKNASETESLVLEEWHNDHLERADELKAQMDADLELAKIDEEVECLTYYQQKTLSSPKAPTNVVYYKRQLNLYNLGIHVGSSCKGIFNLWLENEASKGTQEVGSCLRKYINENIAAPKTQLILWSDACGGQNRSIKLVLMLAHVLQNHPSLQTISIRYRQPGHSFLPNDTEFGDFECALKREERVYTDIDYMKIMQDCRIENKFCVNRMSSQDFLSVKKLEERITNRKTDINGSKINWLETHEILLVKSEPTLMRMKKRIRGDYQTVNIEKAGQKQQLDLKTVELDKLWPEGKPISKEKLKDLEFLLKLVPDESKGFYKSLLTGPARDYVDDVDGYGETIDFDIEEFLEE